MRPFGRDMAQPFGGVASSNNNQGGGELAEAATKAAAAAAGGGDWGMAASNATAGERSGTSYNRAAGRANRAGSLFAPAMRRQRDKTELAAQEANVSFCGYN